MQPPRPRATRFVVDAMLGSLARKLRAVGFDTLYYGEGDDSGMIDICRRERRVLLTADRLLTERADELGITVISVSGRTDRNRMSGMVSAARLRGLSLTSGESRCSLCNGLLAQISPRDAEKSVPAEVARRHRLFWRCAGCGQVYWRGGHWKKLRSLGKLFESEPRHRGSLEMHLTRDQGSYVVSLARATLESYVKSGKFVKTAPAASYLSEKRGVFVTLNTTSAGDEKLRGCIGFPYPVKPLAEAVQEAAVAACSEDPRFPPVRADELPRIEVEVSVLTLPVPLEVEKRQDMPSMLKIGQDGLIISTSITSGLLLPQVATEHKMDAEQFLCNACMKAGLPPDSWLQPSTKVQTFQADIFAEKVPRGEVERVLPKVN